MKMSVLRRSLPLLLVAFISGQALAVGPLALGPCNTRTLSGSYMGGGEIEWHPLARGWIGTMFFDGKGNWSQRESNSSQKSPYDPIVRTGTYEIGDDCRAVLFLSEAPFKALEPTSPVAALEVRPQGDSFKFHTYGFPQAGKYDWASRMDLVNASMHLVPTQ